MAKIGIGVVTYNRLPYLKECIKRIQQHTRQKYELIVADDGSQDGSREWCAEMGIPIVGKDNRGVCWNKNRALFALQALGCDPILLVEDDCLPDVDGWEGDWIIATALYGHVSFAHPKLKRWQISGSGTAIDPIVNNKATAQCASISGEALRRVGFFDTRFKGYGVGHAEWTTRVKRAGYGFKFVILEGGARARANLYISGGIEANDAPTFKDPGNIKRNEDLFNEIKMESIYRSPWRGEDEKEIFSADLELASISLDNYSSAFRPDNLDLRRELRTVLYHKASANAIHDIVKDTASFAIKDGWLASISSGIGILNGELSAGFTDSVQSLLKERIQNDWSVLDFGGGLGSVWWAGNVSNVISLTRDHQEATRGQSFAPSSGKISFIESESAGNDYLQSIESNLQIISIREEISENLLNFALTKIAIDGVVLFSSNDWKLTSSARPGLLANDFKEIKLFGLIPGSWRRGASSIFYRVNNCLKI